MVHFIKTLTGGKKHTLRADKGETSPMKTLVTKK